MKFDYVKFAADLKLYGLIAIALILVVDLITEYIKKALSLDGKQVRIVLMIVSAVIATLFSILASIVWYYGVLLWLCLMAISGGCFDKLMEIIERFGAALALLKKP